MNLRLVHWDTLDYIHPLISLDPIELHIKGGQCNVRTSLYRFTKDKDIFVKISFMHLCILQNAFCTLKFNLV
jgi:hypothetical protein